MTTGSSYYGLQRKHRVNPASSSHCESPNIVEVRKGRWLHIRHIVPNQRRQQPSSRITASSNNQSTPNGMRHSHDVSQTSSAWVSDRTETRTSTHNRLLRDKLWKTIGDDPIPEEVVSLDDNISLDSFHSVVEEGNTAVFFIHGVGGCSELWRRQMDYLLSQGCYEVVAPDLLGHGFSRAPREAKAYTFAEHADDMKAVFDRYCRKQNVLIGHSYGACFCAKIARERSRKVSKVILISGGGPVCLAPEPCQLFCLPSIILTCIKPVIVNVFVSQAFHKKSNHTSSEMNRSFDVPGYVLRATMQGQYWSEGDEDYHAALTVGVLLIYGLQDELIMLEDEEWMQETIYSAQLETLEEAGHMVMLEQPDKVNRLIHQFILKDTMVRAQGARPRAMSTRSTKYGLHGKIMPHVTIT